ncbi:helix-turn-helix domain-containing protein [Paenibacillus flagellatus]|uniref:DNA-binding protein n=1 Tax=Paenibacillus flagellatus TaxID=2211139 RepID=A0A2V5K753_9BACL|nr:XRE family transcriptional regulator [Paenibacillus flagellatus]PYI55271.1 DNA-binding protein [Paenibacillus flagellatus]
MDHIPIKVGKNLKAIRKSRDLSLDKLAELTGVSKAMLAQVERGDSNPTISLLWKIANGLRISVTALIAEQSPEVSVVRFADVEPMTENEGLYRAFPQFPFDPTTHFEVYAVSIGPGCEHQSEPHQEGVEEFVIVTEGELELRIGDDSYRVSRGDAIRFNADQGHVYVNDTDAPTWLQVIIRYPF